MGCGGLGCPAAAYLAGAGVGTLGLVDHDSVETSNLHRQILHATSRVGMSKVDSALHYLQDLNPHVQYIAHREALTSANAFDVLSDYTLVLDCTDHPALRYLVSDTCVLLGLPLVSASALRSEGQLIVLNAPPRVGPCYRCVWPRPPPAASVTSCGEGGILGPVVGVMGIMQALEALKLLVNPPADERPARMLFFAAWADTTWRNVRMRGRRKNCVACGEHPTISEESIRSGGMDYVAFCGGAAALNGRGLKPEERVNVEDVRGGGGGGAQQHLLVDVRDRTQFGICSIPGSINIPFSEFEAAAAEENRQTGTGQRRHLIPPEMEAVLEKHAPDTLVYMLCRLGNDSQVAAKMVMRYGRQNVFDVRGGVAEWARRAPGDGVVEY